MRLSLVLPFAAFISGLQAAPFPLTAIPYAKFNVIPIGNGFSILPLGSGGGSSEANLICYALWEDSIEPIERPLYIFEGGYLLGGIRNNVKTLSSALGISIHTSILADDIVMKIMSRISKIFISHAHLDHISGLIVADLFQNRYRLTRVQADARLKVYSIPQVNAKLGEIAAIKLSGLELHEFNTLEDTGTLQVEAYPVMHGGFPQVSSSCFAVALGSTVICGDLQPSYTTQTSSKTGATLWSMVSAKMTHLLIEVAYPDSTDTSGKLVPKASRTLFGHLSPYYLLLELFDLALAKTKTESVTPDEDYWINQIDISVMDTSLNDELYQQYSGQFSGDSIEWTAWLNDRKRRIIARKNIVIDSQEMKFLKKIFLINTFAPTFSDDQAALLEQLNLAYPDQSHSNDKLDDWEAYLHTLNLKRLARVASSNGWSTAPPLKGLTVRIHHIKTPFSKDGELEDYTVVIMDQIKTWSNLLSLGVKFEAVKQAKDENYSSVRTSIDHVASTHTGLTVYALGSGGLDSESDLPCLILGNTGEVNGKLVAFNAGSFIAPLIEMESLKKSGNYKALFPGEPGKTEIEKRQRDRIRNFVITDDSIENLAGIIIATQDSGLVRHEHPITFYSNYTLAKYFDGNMWPKMNTFGLVELLSISQLTANRAVIDFDIIPVEQTTSLVQCFFIGTVMICGKWVSGLDYNFSEGTVLTSLFIGVINQATMFEVISFLEENRVTRLDVFFYGCKNCDQVGMQNGNNYVNVRQFDTYNV